MTTPSSSPPGDPRNIVPGVIAAFTFAFSDVFGKIVFKAGGDVLTLVGFRVRLASSFWRRGCARARRWCRSSRASA